METNILVAVIAVSGTLAGAIVSAIGTYFIQNVRYKRETDWCAWHTKGEPVLRKTAFEKGTT